MLTNILIFIINAREHPYYLSRIQSSFVVNKNHVKDMNCKAHLSENGNLRTINANN